MLVILDRDGVINFDSADFIKSPDEWEPIPGSLEAIARLNKARHKVVVATNQSGVGRGLFMMATLDEIHEKMNEALTDNDGYVDGIYLCPHHPEDDCYCRKPKPGMLRQIERAFPQVSFSDGVLVGDSLRDIQVAQEVGLKPILVLTGKGKETLEDNEEALKGVAVYDSLGAFVQDLLEGDDQ
jgi:D-glycero-D-manno-heptose 1,7-bisphosphate phosphatase